jgi:hypothetical protein
MSILQHDLELQSKKKETRLAFIDLARSIAVRRQTKVNFSLVGVSC